MRLRFTLVWGHGDRRAVFLVGIPLSWLSTVTSLLWPIFTPNSPASSLFGMARVCCYYRSYARQQFKVFSTARYDCILT
jgi:hypothetical protein